MNTYKIMNFLDHILFDYSDQRCERDIAVAMQVLEHMDHKFKDCQWFKWMIEKHPDDRRYDFMFSLAEFNDSNDMVWYGAGWQPSISKAITTAVLAYIESKGN